MYMLLALVAAIGYALQGTLMASVYRKTDPLSSASYRGLALGISMSPLLLLSVSSDFQELFELWGLFLTASLVGACGSWFCATACCYLAVGIVAAVCQSTSVITASVIAVCFLGEKLTIMQMALIALLLVCVCLLSISRSKELPIEKGHELKGFLFALAFGSCAGAGLAIIGYLSRQVNPLACAYAWELSIGLVACLFAFSRGLVNGNSLQRISGKSFAKILVFSAPTLLGTAGFAYACTLGPIQVATAILTTTVVATALIALAVYREQLSKEQWLLILFSFVIIAGLNLTGV